MLYLANCDSLQISLLPQTDINKSVNVHVQLTYVVNNAVCNWNGHSFVELGCLGASLRSGNMFVTPLVINVRICI